MGFNGYRNLVFLSALALNSAAATVVRLVGGQHAWEGRVEVYHNGWGTVCDDSFGDEEAKVICRMLGYTGLATAYSGAHFGEGTVPILLDDLGCTGRETDIANCNNKGWGKHNCGHGEDAGVSCTSPVSATLVGGRGNFEGTVEIDHGTLCDKSFTDNDASVICRMVGFTKGIAVKAAKFGQLSYGNMKGSNLGCRGNEAHVQFCSGYSIWWGRTTGCNHSMDAGVICDHTPIRLVDGVLPSDGRLEVQHNGVWGTVCGSGFSHNDAEVLCKMMGFSSSSGGFSYGAKSGTGPVWLDSIRCHGNESDIQFCNLGGWGNHSYCDHSNDVGLTCAPTDIRLKGGAGPWEGTLEVHLNNKWGTICDPNFGDKEADVVCRMLGYTRRGAPHTIYHKDYFSHVTSPVIDRIRCHGDESDISQCTKNFYSSCSTRQTVGLKCEGVQVRLAGGAHNSEGRVEILQGGVWGTICDDGWDDVDATVICKMLSSFPFDGEVNGTAMPGSYFGYGTGPVWMSKAACNGTESGISSCSADWTGGVNCDHSRDAGVLCDFHHTRHIESTNGTGTVVETVNGSGVGYCAYGWNNTDGDVICREMGYIAPQAVVYGNTTRFSSSRGMNVLHPECAGDEGHLEMCPLVTRLGQYTCPSPYPSLTVECRPRPLGSQVCWTASTAHTCIWVEKPVKYPEEFTGHKWIPDYKYSGTHEIRLVDGPGPWNGRLEVLSSTGNWGSFVAHTWRDSDSDWVCQQLGFRSVNVSTYTASRGMTSLLYSGMVCDPPFQNIGLCRLDYNISTCQSAACSPVGIDCSGGISAQMANLTSFQGAVQFSTSNTTKSWSVCYDGIDNKGASVICAMAGYANTSPGITTTSTQNHVLFSAIHCEGWETHVGQCQVAQNNTSCDDKAAVSCFHSDCTVSDSRQSGSAMSPFYPSSYPPKKDCIYVITPPGGGVYKLVFNDLKLDGDGDYVEIREGPHGRQLGNFSTSSNVPILVSKHAFYIRFKTNGHSASSRGFNVSWSPLTIEDAVTMGCGQHGWNIAVNTTILRHLFPNTGVSQIKLTDQLCTGKVEGDLVVFRQSYTECATQSKPTSINVVYTNNLLYPEAKSPFPLIVHGYRWKIEVQCDITRGQTIVNNFRPNQTIGHHTGSHSHHIGSSSNYATSVKFFTDGSFFTEIKGNPVALNTGNDVFVQVKMDSDDTHVKMVLDTCYAKPDPNANQAMTYTLINNGCVSDSYTRIVSQGTHETRFVFNAFEFPANHDNVYVYCNATFCPVTDTRIPCTQTCHMARPPIVGRAVGHAVMEDEIWRIQDV